MNPRRDDAGPFLILGVDKDADGATVHAHWREQSAACQRNDLLWDQDDLDWARDLLLDPARRVAADADSPNPDLASGEVRRLARLYHVDGSPPGWETMDPEPPVELPGAQTLDLRAIAGALPQPDVPLEIPTINCWLADFAAAALDPWGVDLVGG